jgi:hypothetical protein
LPELYPFREAAVSLRALSSATQAVAVILDPAKASGGGRLLAVNLLAARNAWLRRLRVPAGPFTPAKE